MDTELVIEKVTSIVMDLDLHYCKYVFLLTHTSLDSQCI